MIDFLYNPQGRISRKGYFLAFFLPSLLLTGILPRLVGGGIFGLILGLIGLFYIWPSIVAVPAKRFHDMGATGWYQLGVVGLMLLALIFAVKGIFQSVDVEALQAMAPAAQEQAVMEAIMATPQAQLGMILFFLVQIAQFILFVTVKGQSGENRYGHDPLESRYGFAD